MSDEERWLMFSRIKKLKGKVTVRDMWTKEDTKDIILSVVICIPVSIVVTLFVLYVI